MVANKYAFLQITRRRFLNEWEAFKKVISRRNIRRRITIPLTLRSEERFSRNAETDLVCRLLLEKKKKVHTANIATTTAIPIASSFRLPTTIRTKKQLKRMAPTPERI